MARGRKVKAVLRFTPTLERINAKILDEKKITKESIIKMGNYGIQSTQEIPTYQSYLTVDRIRRKNNKFFNS